MMRQMNKIPSHNVRAKCSCIARNVSHLAPYAHHFKVTMCPVFACHTKIKNVQTETETETLIFK